MKISGNYLVAVTIVIVFAACKTTKEQEGSVKGTQKVEAAPPKIIGNKEMVLDLEDKVADQKEVSALDSLFMTMRKTPCYGRCPIYTASIYNSGYVVYQGKRFVRNEGIHTGRLTEDQMNSIRHMARNVNYFEFNDEYDRPVTDLPTTYTTMHLNGQKKTIKNRVGGPDALRGFENHVQKILDGIVWTKQEGEIGQ